MRILHLGFEDPSRPGSGGGSLRNHEINRRLAREHQVTVVTAGFGGAVDRTEDGVRYRHVGIGRGYTTSILSYFAALPRVVATASMRRTADLIVEEFAPPFSSLGVARWTDLPTCANVQWYFAREKAAEYHLPPASLGLVERWATRRHRHFVALTEDLAGQIRSVNPRADVTINGMGVDVPRVEQSPQPKTSVFLGRLDVEHKGIDLLLDAFVQLPPAEAGTLVIAGDGRGRDRVQAIIERRRLGDRVRLAGRVQGAEKWDLLASAQVVVMPSRWETFGLVALESFAVGRPVLAFDIPCLRQVVTPDRGRLVRPGDVAGFAQQWRELLDDRLLCNALGSAGRDYAKTMTWDDAAQRQAHIYEAVLRD